MLVCDLRVAMLILRSLMLRLFLFLVKGHAIFETIVIESPEALVLALDQILNALKVGPTCRYNTLRKL